jgi:hypothetical protein
MEIVTIKKSTLSKLDIMQNNIVRYMIGISNKCHISQVLTTLKIFNIQELNNYMKLNFIANTMNSTVCKKMFTYVMFK